MKKGWFLILVLVLLAYGCSKVSEEKPVLNELQTAACESASSNNNCGRLGDLGLVSSHDCCYALNKCCGDGVTGRAVQNTLSDIPVDEFKSVLIQAIKSYFSNSPVLTTVELKDLIWAYFAASGNFVDLSTVGQYSSEQIADIYTKASGKSPTQTTATTSVQPGLYPKGGEVWQVGNTYTIRWSTNWPFGSRPTDIIVINLRAANSPHGTEMEYGFGENIVTIPFAITTNTGSYDWTVPSELPFYYTGRKTDPNLTCCTLYEQYKGERLKLDAGNVYKVKICQMTFSAEPITCYVSEAPFSIVKNEKIPNPQLIPNNEAIYNLKGMYSGNPLNGLEGVIFNIQAISDDLLKGGKIVLSTKKAGEADYKYRGEWTINSYSNPLYDPAKRYLFFAFPKPTDLSCKDMWNAVSYKLQYKLASGEVSDGTITGVTGGYSDSSCT